MILFPYLNYTHSLIGNFKDVFLTTLFFIPISGVYVFVIILVERNVEGIFLQMCKKRLLYMAKITEQNNGPKVKDIVHFKQKNIYLV